MLFYRKHAVKIQIALLSYRIALDVFLFIAGICYGLPLVKSIALASGSVKKLVDFKSYLTQNRLTKREKILKLHRLQLGKDPNADLGQLTSNHLECIYEALLSLTDRCSQLEAILTEILDLESVADLSRHATPRPRKRNRSSSSSSSGSRRKHLPTFSRVRKTKTGIALRTK